MTRARHSASRTKTGRCRWSTLDASALTFAEHPAEGSPQERASQVLNVPKSETPLAKWGSQIVYWFN